MTRNKKLLSAASLAPLLLATAHAQDDERRTGISALTDTITVTATKKADAEDVQNVPIAVSAFGADQLDALNFEDLSTVGALTPNTTLREGTFSGVAFFNIRGTGTLASTPSIDPAIGVFVDGVYLGLTAGTNVDNFDVESVEILRGPQGILFGRNVTGGAALINTTRPTDDFSLKLGSSVNSGFKGTGVEYSFDGIISGPITDTLKAKVAAYYGHDEGWFENLFNGENFGKEETLLLRAALEWDPSDNINSIIRFERGEYDGQGTPFQSHRAANGAPGLDFDRDTADISLNFEGIQTHDWLSVSWETNIDVDFGDGQITNIFGWRDYENDICVDIDSTPLNLFNAACLENPPGSPPTLSPGGTLEQNQISNELRYFGTFGNVELTTGVYFFTQEINSADARSFFSGVARQSGGGLQDTTVFGGFVNLDTHLTDKLTVSTGVRGTYEKKSVDITSLAVPTTGAAGIAGFCSFITGDCPIDFSDSNDWTNFDFRIGLQYQFTDDFMGYATVSTGTRAGGYNIRVSNAATEIPGPFDEETVRNYEIGFRSQPTDALLLNVTAFYQTSENLQRTAIRNDPVVGVLQQILNSIDARTIGIEADARYSVTDNLLLLGSIGYVDGKTTDVFEEFQGDPTNFDDEFALRLPNLAPLTSSASIVHELDLGAFGPVSTRVTYTHRDTSYGTNNEAIFPSTDLLDFNISWRPGDSDNLEVSLFGRNVTNDIVFTSDTQLSGPPFVAFGTSTFSGIAKGRHFGIELDYEF